MAYRIWLLVVGCWLLVSVWGCAAVIEGTKGIAGISTKILEDKRKSAITKTFNYDYNTCYRKVEMILGRIGAYIYARDNKKQLIAIYVSQEDTTPVGIFFKAIDANNTQLEISSPSSYAQEVISTELFLGLAKSLNPEKKEGQSDEEKQMGHK